LRSTRGARSPPGGASEFLSAFSLELEPSMPRKLVSRPKSLLSVAFAVGAIPALSFAQILQTHAESLTSYLPAATGRTPCTAVAAGR
jgi:hypothetical protein